VALAAEDQERDIWVFDFAVQTPTRATFGPALDSMPVWYPDDQRLLYISARDGSPNVYVQRADGTGAAERLTKSANSQFVPSLSPDGALVVLLEQRSGTGNDLMLLRLSDTASAPAANRADGVKTEPLIATMFSELHPEISPDGRWLAYTSTDSGMSQVVVQPFPNVSGGRWQVSADGGSRPVWSPRGKELFYATPKGDIISVSFDDTTAFKVLKSVKLFNWPTISVPGPARTYDVSRDGQRFLMIKEGDSARSNAQVTPISVVLNWAEELKAKLPAK
jgi:serine/threonine-protein kinase